MLFCRFHAALLPLVSQACARDLRASLSRASSPELQQRWRRVPAHVPAKQLPPPPNISRRKARAIKTISQLYLQKSFFHHHLSPLTRTTQPISQLSPAPSTRSPCPLCTASGSALHGSTQ
jgi:hypothetical protein